MKAESTYTIERDIEIEAPIDVVWRTITEPDQISRWLCDSVDVAVRPGANGTLTFARDGEAEPLVVNLAVVSVQPPHLLSFRWCHPPRVHARADNSVLVTFILAALGTERTKLVVKETGLEDVDWPDDEKEAYVVSHTEGWQSRGDSLRGLFLPTQK